MNENSVVSNEIKPDRIPSVSGALVGIDPVCAPVVAAAVTRIRINKDRSMLRFNCIRVRVFVAIFRVIGVLRGYLVFVTFRTG